MAGTNDPLAQMLATALEMEEKGLKFYEEAAHKVSNDLGKDLFRTLAKDEVVHMQRIRTIHGALTGHREWPEAWKSYCVEHDDLASMFKGFVAKHGSGITPATGDLQAVDVGIDLERRAVEFYEKHAGSATDPKAKEFSVLMVTEERTHLKALSDLRLYFTDPAAYFRESERGHLDGA